MPRIAKIRKKNTAKPMIPDRDATEEIKVPSRIFIDGRVVKVLSGRNNLNVLSDPIYAPPMIS